MRYDITTIGGLVEAFGGDSAVANWLGITQPAVANWKARNQIPPGWYFKLFARARREGLSIDPVILGSDENDPDYAALRPVKSKRHRALRASA